MGKLSQVAVTVRLGDQAQESPQELFPYMDGVLPRLLQVAASYA